MILSTIYPFSTTWQDYPDSESLAVAIYILGCRHNCYGCSNKELQKFTHPKAKLFTLEPFIKEVKKALYENKTNKLVLLGGDALHPTNIKFIKAFLECVGSEIEVCIYTGHNLHWVQKNKVKGFKFIKCGKYRKDLKQESKKTDNYIQLASTNQELYDRDMKLISKNGKYDFK